MVQYKMADFQKYSVNFCAVSLCVLSFALVANAGGIVVKHLLRKYKKPPTDGVVKSKVCPISAIPPDPTTECCGLQSTSDRIVGGNATAIDQYPWLVIIEYQTTDKIGLFCGGVLISNQYVLTAGHCVAGPVLEAGTPINVRVGEYNTSNSGPDCVTVDGGGQDCTDGAVILPIDKIIVHPEYHPDNNLDRRNDIAILKLKEMAPYTDFIRPICLPTTDITLDPPANLSLFTAGWGMVSLNQSSSDVKMHVKLPFVPEDECKSIFHNIWKGQLCAGGEDGKAACLGDSGGPLMYENGKLFDLVGIVSFGLVPCGIKNYPVVYTKVFEYLPWIRSNIMS